MNTRFIPVKKGDTNLVFDKRGTYVVYFSNISGKISCTISSEHVKLYMIGMYTMKDKDNFKISTEQIHQAPQSSSDLFVLSIAEDASALSFSGLIRIEKNAQKSHAYQKNQNLILSPEAFVTSKPILEIQANDVFCTHGSTSGPLPKEQIQYLQMRGIARNKAEKLSIEGFKQQVYDRLIRLGITDYEKY